MKTGQQGIFGIFKSAFLETYSKKKTPSSQSRFFLYLFEQRWEYGSRPSSERTMIGFNRLECICSISSNTQSTTFFLAEKNNNSDTIFPLSPAIKLPRIMEDEQF